MPILVHRLMALDALAVEPGDGPDEKADHRWLLLIRQHLDIGEASGAINGHVDLVVTGAIGAPLLAVASDPMPHLSESDQSLDVDVDQVTGPLSLVALHRGFGLQDSQPPKHESVKGPGDGGEGRPQQPGDVAEVQALVPEIHGLLQ